MGNRLLGTDMKVNVIYDNRSDDYERLVAEFVRQGIGSYRFWDAITDRKTVVESINASHKMIVRDAIENSLEQVCIAEQDVTFPAPDGWRWFLANMPETFDIYASSTYVDDLHDKNILCGFHLYVVHQRFYEKFLSIPDEKHIDTAANDLKGNVYVCRPYAALQRSGWSFNARATVDYNTIVKPEDIYYGPALHHV